MSTTTTGSSDNSNKTARGTISELIDEVEEDTAKFQHFVSAVYEAVANEVQKVPFLFSHIL